MNLRPLTADDCERARQWRNQDRSGLRTPFPLTAEMQADFYQRTVCARLSPHRYFAIAEGDGPMLAMGGLTNLEWENGRAEISLVTDPALRGQGIGRASVALLLEEAFQRMRLARVWGECYDCNPAIRFWERMVDDHRAATAWIADTKFWDGRWWPSLIFTFKSEEVYTGCTPTVSPNSRAATTAI